MKSLFESVQSHDPSAAEHFLEHIGMVFYRGTEAEGHVPFRFRQAPKDTFHAIHNQINRMTEERFGLPIRNLTFGSNSQKEAITYGPIKTLVPKGDDYRIFYNSAYYDMTIQMQLEISDVEADIQNAFRLAARETMSGDNYDDIIDMIEGSIIIESLRKHFREPSHETIEVGLYVIMDEVVRGLQRNIALPQGFIDQLRVAVDNDIRHINRSIEEYVEGIVELDGRVDNNQPIEFMIYAPQGFILSSQNIDEAYHDD